ncbi:Predicted flavoprotein CzcO associated with the cation diffusion facilitator CzcD [Novosphingobium mathurense]|uniref:Predicted flavoprotein CzcO associated with the cation diffusion facilitator CzcD n=2 Tax=Novosphingobium mathurense TaxID=428990 RepID=A0A1U6IIN1_9SPHN|nr:Predicted flavoprotein CzcO associated with the cation diffusion facilitator CzcD [Novosphingobium mathurense]
MAAAHYLREAGFNTLVLWEKNKDFGGTWYLNRYPGLECDVPSHLYSFSFDLNPGWTRTYASQPEILAYFQAAGDRMRLREFVRFGVEVTSATWDGKKCVWRVGLSTGVEEEIDILVSAQGMFNRIKWPEIPSLDSFAGKLVHAARWPDELTLVGRRVAVVGSAASAIQMIPEIAREVGHLDVYQRTPSWVAPKDCMEFDVGTIAARAADPALVVAERRRIFEGFEEFADWTKPKNEEEILGACHANLALVENTEVRQKLTPTFNWGCARPLSSNAYYPAFNRANVTLVTERVQAATSTGLVDAGGIERRHDVIICATGFHVDLFLAVIPVRGEEGIDIASAWNGTPRAYLGILTAGFPNLFMLYGPNTNNGSIIEMLELQARYIVRHVEWMIANDIVALAVRPEAEAAYNDELRYEIAKVGVWQGNCHNYYLNNAGYNVTQYPRNMGFYRERLSRPDWDKLIIHSKACAKAT